MIHVAEMHVDRWTLVPAIGALLLCSGTGRAQELPARPTQAAPQVSISDAPPYVPGVARYARAGASGARALNAADLQAVPMADLAPGTLLAVHAESAGFLMVECPGGIPAWVYGAYVRPTEREGIYAVTGTRVNVRPRPSSDTNSYPLPRPLQQGDQLVAIERAAPAKPLAEDWLRVWTPPSICFWIQKSSTSALDASSDGAKLWAETSAALARRQPAPWKAGAAATPAEVGAAVPALARTGDAAPADLELANARALLAAQRAAAAPDFAPVRAAYEAVLALSTSGAAADAARADLELVGVLEAAARMTREIEAEKARRAEELQRQAEALRKESQKPDPLLAVWDAYGRVERLTVDGKTRYFLAVAGQRTTEIGCSSARYDLARFVRCEVGVKGARSEAAEAGALPRVDVEKLQILAPAR